MNIVNSFLFYLESIKRLISGMTTYRSQFILKFLSDLTNLALSIIFMKFIYAVSPGIPGWTFSEYLVFVGTLYSIMVLSDIIFTKMPFELEGIIEEGNFDNILSKPINSLLQLMAKSFDVERIFSLIPNLVILIYGLMQINNGFKIINIVTYLTFIILAFAFYYSICIILCAITILMTRSYIIGALINLLENLSYYPLTIYPKSIIFTFTFLFPIGLMAFYPSSVLLGKITWFYILPLSGVTLTFASISILIYNLTIRKYVSAGG